MLKAESFSCSQPKVGRAHTRNHDVNKHSFFGRLKNEFFYGRDWSGVSTGTFIGMLAAYLRYYNEGRLKESLGWMSPMQFRRTLGLAT